ncbi:unannotated protein [freshwater metagenome]|uniref:Unannotated protein n=1 Tax=freshwater metagenome TaxID=449393 RepID=A0A6J7V9H9_9ZZZZ
MVRDRSTEITVASAETIRMIRLPLISAAVGGTKDCWRLAAALVLRSIKIARKTTAKPATKPCPTFLIINASITGLPNPGAPINAATTTKETAAITV